jgi:hypothetical protein
VSASRRSRKVAAAWELGPEASNTCDEEALELIDVVAETLRPVGRAGEPRIVA